MDPKAPATPGSLAELLELAVAWTAQVRAEDPVVVHARFEREFAPLGVAGEAPSRPAVAALLAAIEEELRQMTTPSPDLDLSLRSFRRWLAGM